MNRIQEITFSTIVPAGQLFSQIVFTNPSEHKFAEPTPGNTLKVYMGVPTNYQFQKEWLEGVLKTNIWIQIFIMDTSLTWKKRMQMKLETL